MKKCWCLNSFAAAVILLFAFQNAEAFDLLDPNGNITIKWDITEWTDDGYIAMVTIFNWQKYRHISAPGWTVGWHWARKEVIWTMVGAQTTFQSDCSQFHVSPVPHCCAPNPAVEDLLPDVSYTQQVANCCRGGVLSSYAQDPATALSAFQIKVGKSGNTNTTVVLPKNFTLRAPPGPGYTCGPAMKVKASLFPSEDGRRFTQAFMTWNVTCTYSQYLAQKAPTCCVSLSTFYKRHHYPLRGMCMRLCIYLNSFENCRFQLRGLLGSMDCRRTRYSHIPAISTGDVNQPDTMFCTRDMCPVKIHWHVKTNYKEYWRVKVTITNRDLSRNFTRWTLALQHPNFDNFTEAFSFSYKLLHPYGSHRNDSAVFWGIKYYNDWLMHAGRDGNVQSELLFRKDSSFTFSDGWAFPRRVYFNGDDCVLPDPQDYPTLPNRSSATFRVGAPLLVSMVAAFTLFFL